jgi:O-antigen ligase/predicted Zn-dependent protease
MDTSARSHSASPHRHSRRLRRTLGLAALASVAAAPLALGAVHLPVLLALSAIPVAALLLRAAVLDRPLLVSGPGALLAAVAVASAAGLWLGLDPPATAAEVARAIGLVALFVVLQARADESDRARRRALLAVAFAGLAVAAIGLGHFLVGAKTLFGFFAYEQAKPPLLSTLGNPNHAAGVLNATALVCLGIAVAQATWTRRIVWSLGFLLAAGASLLSASRGGMSALAAAVAFFPLVGWGARRAAARRSRAEREEGQRRLWLVGLAAFAAAVLALYLYGEVRPVEREMDALAATDLETDGKMQVARVALRAVAEHPWIGLGAGAFWTAHPQWLAEPALATFTHVENEALQAVVDLGVPLGLVLVAAVLWAFLLLLRRARTSWEEAGAAAAAFALLLQGLVDFSLHYAAGFLLTALIAARPAHRRPWFRLQVPRPAALGASAAAMAAVAGLGVWAWPGLEAETRRLEAGAANTAVSLDAFERQVAAFRARHPADYFPCELLAGKALAADEPARALPALACATERNPMSGRIHALTGDAFARLGHRGQALLEYRMAAARDFPTMERVLAAWPDADAIREAAPIEPGPAATAAALLERADRLDDAVAVAEAALASTWLAEATGEVSVGKQEAATVENLASTLHHLYSRQDRDEDALALARKLRAARPAAPRGFTLEATSLVRLKRPDEARARYEEGLARLHGDAELVFALASFELGQKQPEAALAALDRLPFDAPIWHRVHRHSLRASAFRALRDDARARDELRLALRLRPDDKWLRFALADVYLALGRVDEASAEIAPFPDDPGARQLAERIAKRRAQLESEQRKLRSLQILGTDVGG